MTDHTTSVDEFWPDRVVRDVPAPALHALTAAELYDAAGLPRIDVLEAHLVRRRGGGACEADERAHSARVQVKEGRLERATLLELLEKATRVLAAEPNMLEVEAPVTVCGDTHGQVRVLRGCVQ